jgi:hypothetical protein
MNITAFINALTQRLEEYRKRNSLTYFERYEVVATETPKFFKVYSEEVFKDGRKSYGRIVAFIDKATGDIFMPASWKAPAKHARGNVLSPQNGMEAITESGSVRYLRG